MARKDRDRINTTSGKGQLAHNPFAALANPGADSRREAQSPPAPTPELGSQRSAATHLTGLSPSCRRSPPGREAALLTHSMPSTTFFTNASDQPSSPVVTLS